jgi:hypothetical protein
MGLIYKYKKNILYYSLCIYIAYTKTMSHKIPQRNTNIRKPKKQSSSSSSTSSQEEESVSQLAISIDNQIKARIGSVLKDLGIQKWMEENDIKPSYLVKTILSTPAPTAGKKASPAANKIPAKIIDQVLSSKFDDGYADKACIVSHTHRPPAGKLPYTLCATPCGRGLVCDNCAKKAAGKKLQEATKRKGFEVDKHRDDNKAAAKRWATNKKKLLDKEHDNKIRVDASGSSSSTEESSSSKSESSSEEVAPKWTDYEHGEKGGEKYSYLQKEGLVAKMKQGDHIVIGIDKDNNGTIDKLSKTDVLKYERQKFIIDPSAVETKNGSKNDVDNGTEKPKETVSKPVGNRNTPVVRRPRQVAG